MTKPWRRLVGRRSVICWSFNLLSCRIEPSDKTRWQSGNLLPHRLLSKGLLSQRRGHHYFLRYRAAYWLRLRTGMSVPSFRRLPGCIVNRLVRLRHIIEADPTRVFLGSWCEIERGWSIVLIHFTTFPVGMRKCTCVAVVHRRWWRHVVFVLNHGLHCTTSSVGRASLLRWGSFDESLTIVRVLRGCLVLAVLPTAAAP